MGGLNARAHWESCGIGNHPRCSLWVPGCVKTCTSRKCAELFSLFFSFDGDCQSGSFVIERNRDKLSTRKFDIGVFTQPGPIGDKHFELEEDAARVTSRPSKSDTGRAGRNERGHQLRRPNSASPLSAVADRRSVALPAPW